MSLTEPGDAGLRTAEFVLRPITAEDAAADHAAVMETRDLLLGWEQSGWPAEDFTVEANREDLRDLEFRHAEHRAYTYTVVAPAGSPCLGCVYVFPTAAIFLARSAVTQLGGIRWEDVEAVVYFWVRASRLPDALDARLLDALRGWFTPEWGLRSSVFVTSEGFEEQVRLLRGAGLSEVFEVREPGKVGRYLAFA